MSWCGGQGSSSRSISIQAGSQNSLPYGLKTLPDQLEAVATYDDMISLGSLQCNRPLSHMGPQILEFPVSSESVCNTQHKIEIQVWHWKKT